MIQASVPSPVPDGAVSLDALVLAGGRSSRLGGTDKAGVVVGQGTLLEHALAGAARVVARRTVVVGPPGLAAAPVLCVQEAPAFGGPAAGVAAGLRVLSADWVLVLACDLPRAPDVAVVLRAALDGLLDDAATDQGGGDGLDGLCLQDTTGRVQWLAGIYRRSALDRAVADLAGADGLGLTGAPVGRLLGRLTLRTVADPADVGADVDTWEDVDRARADAGLAPTAPRTPGPHGAQLSPTRPDRADPGRDLT